MKLAALVPYGESQEAIERTAAWIAALSDDQWATLAGAAGVHVPSLATRKIVCDALLTRQPIAQHHRRAS